MIAPNISGYSWVRRRNRMGGSSDASAPICCCCSAIASLLIACALAASTTAFAAQRAAKAKPEPQAPIDTCKDEAGLTMLASPMAPWKGAPLRVVFAAEKPLAGELSLIAPNGHVAATNSNRRGGPPYFWFAEVASPAAGTWQAILVRHGASADCATVTREIVVQTQAASGPARRQGRVAHQERMEPRDGKSVLRLDRDIVRRAARRGAVVEGDA